MLMITFKRLLFIIYVCEWMLMPTSLHAQFTVNNKSISYDKNTQTFLVSINQDAFGKDYKASIIIDQDSAWSNLTIENTPITNNEYVFQNVTANKTYIIKALRNQEEEVKANITFTYLPILTLQGNFGYDYAKGTMLLAEPDCKETTIAKIKAKWRGGSTNTDGRHKRNYKIKTINEEGKNKDYSFLNLRKDNNWILDAGQIDLFRMRNRIATELWNDFATKPYYANQEPKAQSGVNGRIIEVILNNEYQGIYSFTEAMDRKEMKLKKYDEDKEEFHGMLWKTTGYGLATFWEAPNEYDNNKETWNVFETKYPDIDDVCPTDYSLLYNAINFVAKSDDATFKAEIADYFDIPVLIDYYIFINAVNGIDNIGKNMYWAVYDKAEDKRLTPAIWDLDATVGQNYIDNPLRPDIVRPDNQLGITGLNIYNRLIQLNVDNFNIKVYKRYKELREKQLSLNELLSRYQKYYNLIKKCGASKREESKWSYDSDIAGNKLNFDNEYTYIAEWFKQRLPILDKQFLQLTTSITEITKENTHIANSSTFNLQGQKVKTASKGIYIINGKKIIK